MSVVIGIDVGGSTTKIVGYTDAGKLVSMLKVEAADPLTSAYGALGKFINENGLALSDVQQIILTGVGSSLFKKNIYGIATSKVDEFEAIGSGGLALSGKKEGLIVSMGTGTSFVRIDGDKMSHIGGAGIGGGTLQGLSRLLLKTHNIRQVAELAQHGDQNRVNLLIGDICNAPLPDLPIDATASLFGKADSDSSEADIACGIIYMVFRTIGNSAVLAALNSEVKDFVLIGKLTQLPQCNKLFARMGEFHGVRFHIPPYAEYRTAIGAALAYTKK